jgi:hypothetical protein
MLKSLPEWHHLMCNACPSHRYCDRTATCAEIMKISPEILSVLFVIKCRYDPTLLLADFSMKIGDRGNHIQKNITTCESTGPVGVRYGYRPHYHWLSTVLCRLHRC